MSERKPSKAQAWSPYGLEAYRVQLLRRRSRLLQLAMVVGVVLMAAMLLNSIHSSTLINVHNGDGSTISIKVPDTPRPKPTTLSIAPGKTTVLQQPIQPEARPQTPPPDQNTGGVSGLNWASLLSSLVPPFAIIVAASRYAKKRVAGPLEQVNLGIFKGAMPLEMITATHRSAVYTPRMAYASVFGKAREDYITVTPAGVLGGPSLSERYREALARETAALRHALDGKFAALARYRQRRAEIARQKALLAARKEAIKQEYKRKLAAIEGEMARLQEEQARAEAEAKAAAGEFHDAGELE